MQKIKLVFFTVVLAVCLTACKDKTQKEADPAAVDAVENGSADAAEDGSDPAGEDLYYVDGMEEGVPYYEEDTGEIYFEGLVYTVKSNDELILSTYYDETYTSLQIPEKISIQDKTYTVTEIGEDALLYYEEAREILLPSSILAIGNGAFYGCFNLEEIELPSNLKYIGYEAFCNCEALTQVTIPDSVVDIGYDAFYDCLSLRSAALGKGLSSLADGLFSGCATLYEVILPESIRLIGEEVFWGCGGLKELVIPASIVEIGEDAFYDCGIQSISLYTEIRLADESIFSNCSELETVYVTEGNLAYYKELFAEEAFAVEPIA